jgi:dTDP-4-dehydrorhamnose 3,5-epimerase
VIFEETKLSGAFIISVEKREDERGFFGRAWCLRELEEHGIFKNFVQANVSFNHQKGTLRGLHYQIDPYQEVKFMRCTRGAMYDVIVDLRPQSPTYKQWIGVELTADNYKMLYVPEGFAHGYQTLEDNTEVFYPTTQFYSPVAERGLRWNDPTFAISWPIPDKPIISEKDNSWADYTSPVS